ncbi:hypothetical protein CYMTET_7283 [Cymbomonas tetramitiformis]|uniref:Uncharacterized protein n=1 Tax=Cymbomonas tetramitiformis TaxID=36881 RepID=A0AAE0GVK2_9CHLO|nr:hypothetical protein CYMTET_7283 [Cymbomonas tetramitiformis]
MADDSLNVFGDPENNEDAESVNITGYEEPLELLERGLSPVEVADTFYNAVFENNLDIWLATLAQENKVDPTPFKQTTSPVIPSVSGAFATVGWQQGRKKLRKYGTHYHYEGEDKKASGTNPQTEVEFITLLYSQLYGPVPGYKEDTPLGEPVKILLIKELEEWRVVTAEF